MTFFKFFMYRMQGVLAFLKTLISYRGWLLFCLFNQSELTSHVVTHCRVSGKIRDFKIQERGHHQKGRSRVGPVSRTPCLWREK